LSNGLVATDPVHTPRSPAARRPKHCRREHRVGEQTEVGHDSFPHYRLGQPPSEMIASSWAANFQSMYSHLPAAVTTSIATPSRTRDIAATRS